LDIDGVLLVGIGDDELKPAVNGVAFGAYRERGWIELQGIF
jgi:hypothetical protein